MRKALIYVISCLFLISIIFPCKAGAESHDLRVVIIYDSPNEEVYRMDSLVGHFTNDITIRRADEVGELSSFTHVIYLSMNDEKPTLPLVTALNDFHGPVFQIGQHIEDFSRGSFVDSVRKENIQSIIVGDSEVSLEVEKVAFAYNFKNNTNVIYKGKAENEQFPIVFSDGANLFATVNTISGMISHYVGEALFSFFGVPKGNPVKVLRLEDIHPKTDPKILQQIGEYLWEKKIPYMMTIIPVYTNPNTGEEVHLNDEKELVRVLKYMQDHGASFILHGYKHQYRSSETGEGFEYWDALHDRPIYQNKDEKVLLRKDFQTEKEYETFVEKGKMFEKEYIHQTVSDGIKEMAEQGLFPLGFEPPHYAMSLEGYKALTNYFTTYVGETQISNETYQTTFAPLFDSEPAFMHGLKLVPETLGYIDPNDEKAVESLQNHADFLANFSDSYLSFFYHPYLGLDPLKEVIDDMEKYKDYKWLDLKMMENRVQIDGITITSEDGVVNADISMKIKLTHMVKTMWWFSIPLLLFIVIVIYSSVTRRRRGDSRPI
ncbi:DUF2334 domain-containing protein [Bacillus niameyensis]|uniref:DUF2334 domain-containing protein n=1 Tax=Bacillus niameyensis TaxID=1522308 RepID=UPI00078350D1|nr:DUF2334 domain-containing protein [Bacillus niameyensis]